MPNIYNIKSHCLALSIKSEFEILHPLQIMSLSDQMYRKFNNICSTKFKSVLIVNLSGSADTNIHFYNLGQRWRNLTSNKGQNNL